MVTMEFHVVVLERHGGGRVFFWSRMPFKLAFSSMDFTALREVRAASSNAFSRKTGSWPASKHALRVVSRKPDMLKHRAALSREALVTAQDVDHPGSASVVVASLMKRQQWSKMER
jgi:hypothetical protein